MSDEKFWLDDPAALFNSEFIPLAEYNFVRKMNALTRLILVLTLFGLIFSRSIKVLFSSLATICIIVILYRYKKKEKESFANIDLYDEITNSELFTNPTEENPFMNRLRADSWDKKPSQPITEKVEENINNIVKERGYFYGDPHFTKDPKLYADLGDNEEFERSMRQFYTVSNNKLPNDQGEFAKYCYGNMLSCKGGDLEQCLKKADGALNPSP